MKTTAEYQANPVRRNVTTCRRCGSTLTADNARRYDGRWVGACRKCESIERLDRESKQGDRKAARTLALIDQLVEAHPLATDDGGAVVAVSLQFVAGWLEQLAGEWA